jgi:hypothetical protein
VVSLDEPTDRDGMTIHDRDRLDYEQTLETYRQLTDIRFKLLAFVPTLSGVAIALLDASDIGRWETVALAALGFVVTFGIVLYEKRNTIFYNGAIGRAQFLEERIGFERFGGDEHRGLFGSRRDHRPRWFLGLPVQHDLGLALVYCPALGAWVFAAVHAIWPARPWIALIAGLVSACIFFVEFAWKGDSPSTRLRRWLQLRRK